MNLSWHNTYQVPSRLAYFYRSYCPFLNLVFRIFLCSLLRYRLEIWYINLSWHNTDPVRVSSRLTYLYKSYCPLLKFSFFWTFFLSSFDTLTLYFIYDVIHVKFKFCPVWPTFNWVIALCTDLVFLTFLFLLLWYSLEIWYMNLSWHNTDLVWLLLYLT